MAVQASAIQAAGTDWTLSEHRVCAVIPNYNQTHGFEDLVRAIQAMSLPLLIVNDGSDEATTSLISRLAAEFPQVEAIHSLHNGGKGSAVIKGMLHAASAGYTHALQIDADGQHDARDIEKFISASREAPTAVICGTPLFDDSAPTVRLIGRNISQALVWLHTLSFEIRDSMCGFRVYPLASTVALLNSSRIGRRMDFDIEILVRLYWRQVEIKSIPTRVIYPEANTSNYRYFRDNIRITLLHLKLLLMMLLRLPQLLKRKKDRIKAAHWASIREKGSIHGMRVLIWLYRHVGRWSLRLLLHPIILYYTLTAGTARRASREFLERVARARGESKRVTWLDVYAHLYQFGLAASDKFAAWNGDIPREEVTVHGREVFEEFVASTRGAVFVGSHLGNLDLCRALVNKDKRVRINAVVFNKNALKFQSALTAASLDANVNLIHVEEIGVDTALLLQQKIEEGEAVIIVGDRTSVQSVGRVVYADFLGDRAPFSEGPWILARILQCPVYLIFCLKEDDGYHLYFEHFASDLDCPRPARKQFMEQKVQAYADRLSYFALRSPMQWFNFYDFWVSDSVDAVERRPVMELERSR